MDTILAVNALLITLIALVLTLFIALNQQYQLDELQIITKQTKETTEILDTQSEIRKAVESFFKTKDSGNKKYQLIFPVIYSSKPLPLINQGDFYAINVVISRLGEPKIKNIPYSSSYHSVGIGDYVIFICSPDANPVLKNYYDIYHIQTIDGKVKAIGNDPKIPNNLPCWFVSDKDDGNQDWKIRKILVSETDELIFSKEVRDLYEKANLNVAQFVHPQQKQRDYGIFGRWQHNGSQFIVIAGIHQYGTWIIGKLLNDLFCGKSVKGKNIFLGNQDFISIIDGDFDYPTLQVTRAELYESYIWTRTKINDNWVKQKTENLLYQLI
jgi:hypothetical protein